MPDRPPAVRTDGTNAFAHRSMKARIPSIIDDVIARNPDRPPAVHDALRALRDAIRADAALTPLRQPTPDADWWAERLAERPAASWLDGEWFFVELYAYRKMLEATRYWTTQQDPFRPMKHDDIHDAALPDVVTRALQPFETPADMLTHRLHAALWGNRMDRSIAAAHAQGTQAADDHLLVNDIPAAVEHLLQTDRGTVHVVMDNAGTEQALDFALADGLLTHDLAETVVLHVKMAPVLISDVTPADVPPLLDRLAEAGGPLRALAEQFRQHIADGRLRIVPDFFWTTDGRWFERPARLAAPLQAAALVIVKGDANYRRITNDALWPAEATLADALGPGSGSVLALRTIKSDTLVGVPPATVHRLDEASDDWRTTGTYAVASFAQT
ncbi:ARMT1-like domain-containing protein [Salisaeta longa]|uniref:ARMT1-like domain-containing protein n=1 Tax=Salisaeta longa TaxID=503170 RepID=UPI0003B773DB|nr:ARMT1-like domain-containing protein [Salisaeta longa]